MAALCDCFCKEEFYTDNTGCLIHKIINEQGNDPHSFFHSPIHTLKMTNNLLADAFIGQVTSPEVARIKAFFCRAKLLRSCLISFLHWALQSSQPVSQILIIISTAFNASNLGTETHYRSRLADLFFLSPDIFTFLFSSFERFIIRPLADVIKLTGI